MKTLKPILTLILFAIISINSTAQDWHKVKSKEGKFKALMPCDVEVTEEQKDSYKSIYYQCVYDGSVYQASAALHQNEPSDDNPVKMAEISLEAIHSSIGGDISNVQLYYHGKHIGKSAEFSIPDKNMTAFYHVIFINNIQYQTLVINTSSDNPKHEIRKKFQDKFIPKK